MANVSLNDSIVYVATYKKEKDDDSVVILQSDFPKKEERDESAIFASYSADKSSSSDSSSIIGSPPDYTAQLIELYKRRSTLLPSYQSGGSFNEHEMSSNGKISYFFVQS